VTSRVPTSLGDNPLYPGEGSSGLPESTAPLRQRSSVDLRESRRQSQGFASVSRSRPAPRQARRRVRRRRARRIDDNRALDREVITGRVDVRRRVVPHVAHE
jgi:hypothetical protein